MNRQTAVLSRTVIALLMTGALMAPAAASAGTRSHSDRAYDNPRYDGVATLAVEGTLETVVIDGFNENAGADYQYGVRTEEGDLVELPASFAKDAPTGGAFKGELALTGELASDLKDQGVTVEPGTAIDADSATGQTVVDMAADQGEPLPVASATVAEPVAAATTATAHRLYVAVMTNNGTALPAGAISQIRNYWIAQSDGAIATFDVAATTNYVSTISSSDTCGLAGGHEAVWQEAKGKFPGVDFGADGNHLMVVVADSCSGAAGLGTVGSSINDGGLSIVTAAAGMVQIGAHELGHNFGLGHANLESCESSCTVRSYYNAYSVMGFAINSFPPPALDTVDRAILDLADNVDVISTVGESTVELEPRSDDAGRRGLKVVDSVNNATYFIDYRSGTGGDAGAFYAVSGALSSYRFAPGVVITQQQAPGNQTKVLTSKDGSLFRAYVPAGGSFTNSAGTMRVVVNSVAGVNGAVVTVSLNSTPFPSSAPAPALVPQSAAGPAFLSPVVPTISGTHKVGRTLKVNTGQWAYGPTLTYRWYANGKAISKATKSSYKVTKGKKRKYITVRVSAVKTGFVSASRTSLRTTKVR